jgi:Na+-translocating ferredoxin:NAD+ oxidoreductase RNF subunit RnfB
MESVFIFTLCAMGGIGFVLGAGLSYASKKFAVEKNAQVEEIIAILPGANCGGCGYPGCAGYADAIVIKGAPANMCAPGGGAVSRKIAQILGIEELQAVRKVACLHCAGSRDHAKDKYRYNGIRDCQMAVLFGGGPKVCEYGCMGFDSCVRVCKFDALHMGENGLPVVDRKKCTGCGACVRVCPKHLFDLLPDTTMIYLACSSHEKGKAVKDACSVGCIGCGICAKVTPDNVIQMKDNLPVVDYNASTNLVLAHYKCPTKSYIDLVPKRPHLTIDTKCKGHGKCAGVCPVKDCVTGEPGKPHHIDPKKCIGCGLCLDVCPEKAIRVVGAMGYVGMDMSK